MDLNPNYPVFANTRPWNELILRGVRKFKPISFPWKYRGTIYLYDTKGCGDLDGPDWAEDYNIKISADFGWPGCIVGTVEVYGIRSFGETETGADFEILLRNPQRFLPIEFRFRSRGRIARVPSPESRAPEVSK